MAQDFKSRTGSRRLNDRGRNNGGSPLRSRRRVPSIWLCLSAGLLITVAGCGSSEDADDTDSDSNAESGGASSGGDGTGAAGGTGGSGGNGSGGNGSGGNGSGGNGSGGSGAATSGGAAASGGSGSSGGSGGTTQDSGGSDNGGGQGGEGSGGTPGGCPLEPPSDGSACETGSCLYRDCANYGQIIASCQGGTWSLDEGACETFSCSTGGPCSIDEICLTTGGDVFNRRCVENTCGDEAVTCDCLQSCEGETSCETTGTPEDGIQVSCGG